MVAVRESVSGVYLICTVQGLDGVAAGFNSMVVIVTSKVMWINWVDRFYYCIFKSGSLINNWRGSISALISTGGMMVSMVSMIYVRVSMVYIRVSMVCMESMVS